MGFLGSGKAEMTGISRVGFVEPVKTDQGQESVAEAVKSDKGQVSTAEFVRFMKVVTYVKGQETFDWMKTAGMVPEAEGPVEKNRTAGMVPHAVPVKSSKGCGRTSSMRKRARRTCRRGSRWP